MPNKAYKLKREFGLCGKSGCSIKSESSLCLPHMIENRLFMRKHTNSHRRGPKGAGRSPIEVTVLGEEEGV